MSELNITNEDNMALMARYPDNYFDLAIADPPYGINITKNKRLNNNSENNWDIDIPKKEYFDELYHYQFYLKEIVMDWLSKRKKI